MEGGVRRMNRKLHRGLFRRGSAVVFALTLAAGLATACSEDTGTDSGQREPVPGVTDTEILVGSHQPLTGPAAPGYSKIAPATKAYFDYVNAAGGVHGRKINYKFVDDAYNPSNTAQVVRELVLQDKVFAILNGLGTPTHTNVLEFLKTQRVPDLFVASGSRSWDQPDKYPYTFGYQPDYTVEGKILATYVKTNFAGQKVCFLGQNDDFGRDELAGIEKILGTNGLAAKEQYVPTNQNVAPQIGAFKSAGCTVVILGTVPGFTALVLGTAARLTYKPQWVVSSVGGDYRTLAGRLGDAGKPLLEGLLSAGYLPSVDDNADPWVQLFKKVNDQHNKGVEFDGNVMYGMSVGYLFVQALQVAGKDLSRQGIVDAIEKGGFKNAAGVAYRYSKTDHSGIGGLRMGRVEKGVQLGFGPYYATDEGDGAIQESSDKPTAPPTSGIPTNASG
jgi:ABC-type branched-subunit amino acid transport system substrate-binding protein